MDLARKALVTVLAATWVAAPSAGQKKLAFDAASVKAVAVPDGVTLSGDGRVGVRKGSGLEIPRNTGGPGTDDPGRIHWPFLTVKQLLRRAWDSYAEIDGPGWLDSQAVAVEATMPADTNKAQFLEMLRNLITERFGLQYHAGKKEITGYALGIARNGPKLKESADQREAEFARPGQLTRNRDKDGFNTYTPVAGKMMLHNQMGDRSRITAQQVTLEELARSLASELKATVRDATGLTAKYNFVLTYTSPEPAPPPAHLPEGLEPLPDVFAALQSQLGLKLDRKAVPVDVFVVDRMERTPKGN
jgi:uncharacterized protein (TIGR03435 family)